MRELFDKGLCSEFVRSLETMVSGLAVVGLHVKALLRLVEPAWELGIACSTHRRAFDELKDFGKPLRVHQ